MPSIGVEKISKSFAAQIAVDEASFEVEPGEIFGLLGPNGAGKTTTIRIILDIFKPDRGKVSILGGGMTESKKNQIGYMPEERGLYQDITLDRCLTYLASLKGLESQEARRRINVFLDRFDLAAHRRKKVKELSKGMQQKAQLIATLVHQPDLIIIDEPFTALDPLNTQMIKEILVEEKRRGVAIVMSTHQMHQVEELCDRLVLINRGKVVLYGSLGDIRKRFAAEAVLARTPDRFPSAIPGVESITPTNGVHKLTLIKGTEPQAVLRWLVNSNISLEEFEIAVPTLDEIFIKVVQSEELRE